MSAISPHLNPNYLMLCGLNASLLKRLEPELMQFLEASNDLAQAISDFTDEFASMVRQLAPNSAACQCAPVSAPAPQDSCHPSGNLTTEGNTVTTAGGYRIEMLGQYEWQITGPDGKTTRVWGDPHVAEGDGGTWDFKRNSTFMLGDGTRINVTTVPGGAQGMTVTGQLEIISGNDRVLVTGIDKGVGQIGTITQDGFQQVNGFGGNDVFVMGRETDDWSFRGREIIGSNDGGESFKLGCDLRSLRDGIGRFGGGYNWASSVFEGLLNDWQDSWRSSGLGFNAYSDNRGARWETEGNYDRSKHIRTMRRSLRAMGEMFNALSRWMLLSEQLSAGRNRRPLNV